VLNAIKECMMGEVRSYPLCRLPIGFQPQGYKVSDVEV